MSSAILGLYGVFVVLVAYHGNSSALLASVSQEKAFVPWVIVILVLASLEANSATHKFVAPFAALAIITFLVTKFTTVQTDIKSTYSYLTGSGAAAVPTATQ